MLIKYMRIVLATISVLSLASCNIYPVVDSSQPDAQPLTPAQQNPEYINQTNYYPPNYPPYYPPTPAVKPLPSPTPPTPAIKPLPPAPPHPTPQPPMPHPTPWRPAPVLKQPAQPTKPASNQKVQQKKSAAKTLE